MADSFPLLVLTQPQYTDGWRSAVTDAQWNTIWGYQSDFRVRMVRINEFPGPAFGAALAGTDGCCNTGVEQLISFTNTTGFPTANLKTYVFSLVFLTTS